MTIFDLLKDVIYNKSKTSHTKSDFDNAIGSSYIFQRWITMLSTNNNNLLNATTNRLYIGLDDNEMWYKLLSVLIDKQKYYKISYIKRQKKEINEEQEEIIALLASALEVSKEEFRNLVEFFNYDLKDMKTILNY